MRGRWRQSVLDILVREFLGAAIDEVAEVARVDEQDFAFARVTSLSPNPSPACGRGESSGAVHEPQCCRYLCIQK